MKYSAILGSYYPSFFFIETNYGDVVDENDILKHERTLFHEYIHYIQDLTSVVSYINIIHTITKVHEASHQIGYIIGKKQLIYLPLCDKYLQKRTLENKSIIDNMFRFIQLKDKNNHMLINYSINDDNAVKIEFSDGKKQYFDVVMIIESMAKNIEDYMFGKKSSHYPYNMCKKMIELIYSSFPSDAKFLIALCDASLTTLNPPETFVNTLNSMKKENYVPKTMTDVYDYVSARISYYGVDLKKIIEENYREAKRVIESLCRKGSFLYEEGLFLQNQLDKGYTLRKISYFWSDILEAKDKDSTILKFVDMIKEIGLPPIFDIKNYSIYAPILEQQEDINWSTFVALFMVREAFFTGENRCFLLDFCKNSPSLKTIVNNDCSSNPFQQKAKCPFKMCVEALGLKNIPFSYK